ncbi:MAG: ribosome silencing factor [Clostridiales bacterium]|nr:ribosome silencing factor [Clostridiales bacterium]
MEVAKLESQTLLRFCAEKALEKKARDVLGMDLSGLSLICDYFLLMTVTNSRQCQAIADFIREELGKVNQAPLRQEGYSEGRWLLLDCSSVIVHIFQDEERKYYNLERLWGDAPLEYFSS